MKTKQFLASIALAALGLVDAHAQVSKPISKLPFVITKPGNYYLPKDLVLTMDLPAGTASAITVRVSDVTINLNGRSLSSTVNAGIGIGGAEATLTGIRIQNGTIRGFENAVYIVTNNGSGFLAQDLFLETCKSSGIYFVADNCAVRRCTLRALGDTTLAVDPEGVAVFGNGTVVEDTTISDVMPRQGGNFTSGIATVGDGTLITRCRVISSGVQFQNGIGLRILGKRSVLRDNQIINQHLGILLGDASSKFRDNIITDCALTSNGGTDAGNNK